MTKFEARLRLEDAEAKLESAQAAVDIARYDLEQAWPGYDLGNADGPWEVGDEGFNLYVGRRFRVVTVNARVGVRGEYLDTGDSVYLSEAPIEVLPRLGTRW